VASKGRIFGIAFKRRRGMLITSFSGMFLSSKNPSNRGRSKPPGCLKRSQRVARSRKPHITSGATTTTRQAEGGHCRH
jgi:hypothetical protein